MNSSLKFIPVRGLDANITNSPIRDGYIYFATDTGRIYLDKGNERCSLGGVGAGASIYYAKTPATLVPNADKQYLIAKEYMQHLTDNPAIWDIILNVTDGSFYRVLEKLESGYLCERLSVSGGGGTGVAGATLEIEQPPMTVINGQDVEINVTAFALLNEQGNPRDETLALSWSIVDLATGTIEANGTKQLQHGVRDSINLGPHLWHSTTSECTMYVLGINSGKSDTKTFQITTSELELTHSSTFSNITPFMKGSTTFTFNTIGNLEKIITVEFDKGRDTYYYQEQKLTPQEQEYSITIPQDKANHGYHTVSVELYQDLGNGRKGVKVEPGLSFEIAVVDAVQEAPIIWLGDYKEQYFEYDDIQIPFLVYDPNNTEVKVEFYNSGVFLVNRIISNFAAFNIFEITDATMDRKNVYEIICGTGDLKQIRTVEFTVVKDENRQMVPTKLDYLTLSFDAKGRSNNDPLSRRVIWNNPITSPADMAAVTAEFTNFNWYNNGWMMEDNQSLLRISNGASVIFNIGDLKFAGTENSNQSHTFEFQFKMKNIQDYGNLVKNITRYKDDGDLFNKDFKDPTKNIWGHTNYDAFLHDYLSPEAYEALEFDFVYKELNFDNIVCGYYTPTANGAVGLCLGPQDAFFSNGADTVSVNYVEDEMVNLTMVYKHSTDAAVDSLIYIYINGVITGIIKSGVSQTFSVGTDQLIFNSQYCDIDLYRMRIYKTALDVKDVVHNYAVDYKSALIYDHNALAYNNNNIGEYQFNYQAMLNYNAAHPDNPLMPYIVFDTSAYDTSTLPHSKAEAITIDCEFVNTMLDKAYRTGELQSLAINDKLCLTTSTAEQKVAAVKEYYRHHCPSWKGFGIDLEVQGTSSEFYPRRNYKVKTKIKREGDSKKRAQIYLHKGPFIADYALYEKQLTEGSLEFGSEPARQDVWYMDNYTNGTDRWTMKVDYMESSGSYNAGFAGLIGNAYSKHPLKDYVESGAIDPYKKNENGEYVDASNNVLEATETNKRVDLLKSNITKSMRWEDYRTSLLGFPVLAFHKKSADNNDVVFIGYYRMLLDKGSDDVLGFNPDDNVTQTLIENQSVNEVAECWEFANNARTFCSYKDPWNRVELSFKAPASEGAAGLIALPGGKLGGPLVLQHFEPRYVLNDDYLKDDEDGFYNFGSLSDQNFVNTMCDDVGIPRIDITQANAPYKAQEGALKMMRNWESACKWVYSTWLDNVSSQGTYEEVIGLGAVLYEPNKYFIRDEGSDTGYTLATGAYEDNVVYFKEVQKTVEDEQGNSQTITAYDYAYVVNSADKVYQPNQYYIETQGTYFLSSDANFDHTATYYTFETLPAAEIAKIADLLVEPATEYDSEVEYYSYNSNAKFVAGGGKTDAVTYRGKVSQADFEAGACYVPKVVKYVNTEYAYDTKEYRTAKFINELSNHFDIEYLATYFIATEVFECYDSRGKNCMMASWGPQREGGDYIWYPIFYDIDTQLGINNTGIPSFEFNVDATDAGNFSTSDSILWNNFYKFFKGSSILSKYKHMKGVTAGVPWSKLQKPPLRSVENLEGWYTFDPNYNGMIACRGQRPLIATNLDAYWKYITITNPKGTATGITGYLDRNGKYVVDTNGKYFYALQGDRSQSRIQFLTNRLEYIDSWLNQGNYARGGENCIRGRVSANDSSSTSDIWLEGSDGYWADTNETIKKYPFDAEYWVNLTPIRSSYVTLSDDSIAYPSQKYDGINPIKFKVEAIENGVRNSAGYPEQLLYIYGMNQMSDVGALHNLYWREFVIDGDATKLTKLNLGYDALASYTDKDGIVHDNVRWFNQKLNQPSIPSAKKAGSKGMPLLKEVNLSNITIQAGGANPTMDFTSCEKLENFRATGSSLVDIKFADGVALNTLYVPRSLATLELNQANLLTNLITEYQYPTINPDGTLRALPGLYVEGLSNKESALTTLKLQGGALGYHSYTLLQQFYTMLDEKSKSGNITLTDVKWSPYVKVVDGEGYDSTKNYVLDNGHYGFIPYEHNNMTIFQQKVLSGEIYRQDIPLYIKINVNEKYNVNYHYYTLNEGEYTAFNYSNEENFNAAITTGLYRKNDLVFAIDDTAVDMLLDFIDNTNYKSASAAAVPELSGIIYIHNTAKWDEGTVIRQQLQEAFPNMTFFFANEITEAYSAKFVLVDHKTGAFSYVTHTSGATNPSIQKIAKSDYEKNPALWFTNPYTEYEVTREHHDFFGWATTPTGTEVVDGEEEPRSTIIAQEDWDDAKNVVFNEAVTDYVFYAILTPRIYTATFKDPFDSSYNQITETAYSDSGAKMSDDVEVLPVNNGASDLYMRNTFKGWAIDEDKAQIVYGEDVADADLPIVNVEDYIAIRNYTFYAVYKAESVFNTILDDKYLSFSLVANGYTDQYNSDFNATGYRMEVNWDYVKTHAVSGKITLPTVVPQGYEGAGSKIIIIAAFSKENSKFQPSHIFFDNRNGCEIRQIAPGTFANAASLVHFDFNAMTKLRVIGSAAFQGCTSLQSCEFKNNIYKIDSEAFYGGAGSNAEAPWNVVFGPALRELGDQVFRNGKYSSVVFGGPGAPSSLEIWNHSGKSAIDTTTASNRPLTVKFYCADEIARARFKAFMSNTPPIVSLQSGGKDEYPNA